MKNDKSLFYGMRQKKYWCDILAISVLLSFSVISGCVNYLTVDESLTFANILLSFLQLALWAVWAYFALAGRGVLDAARIFYSLCFALSTLASATLLLMSLTATGADGAAVVMLIICSPMYGLCLFDGEVYILNELIMLISSALWLMLPFVFGRIEKKKNARRKARK